jgi:hypothetical protein
MATRFILKRHRSACMKWSLWIFRPSLQSASIPAETRVIYAVSYLKVSKTDHSSLNALAYGGLNGSPSSSHPSNLPRNQAAFAFPIPRFSSRAAQEPSGISAFALNRHQAGRSAPRFFPLLFLMVYLCKNRAADVGPFWTGWREPCRSIERASIIRTV